MPNQTTNTPAHRTRSQSARRPTDGPDPCPSVATEKNATEGTRHPPSPSRESYADAVRNGSPVPGPTNRRPTTSQFAPAAPARRSPDILFSANEDFGVAYPIPDATITERDLTLAFARSFPDIRFKPCLTTNKFAVSLTSQADRETVLATGLEVGAMAFQAQALLAVDASSNIFSLRIEGIPTLTIPQTTEMLKDSLKEYGEVIHQQEQKDPECDQMATGIWYVILHLAPHQERLPPHSFDFKWRGRHYPVRIGPDSTPAFCNFCRSKSHLRATCTEAPGCKACGLQSHPTTHCRNRGVSPQVVRARLERITTTRRTENITRSALETEADLVKLQTASAKSEQLKRETAAAQKAAEVNLAVTQRMIATTKKKQEELEKARAALISTTVPNTDQRKKRAKTTTATSTTHGTPTSIDITFATIPPFSTVPIPLNDHGAGIQAAVNHSAEPAVTTTSEGSMDTDPIYTPNTPTPQILPTNTQMPDHGRTINPMHPNHPDMTTDLELCAELVNPPDTHEVAPSHY